MNRNKTAITAMTNRICMIAPALYAKNPTAQKITKITATVYNKSLILFTLNL